MSTQRMAILLVLPAAAAGAIVWLALGGAPSTRASAALPGEPRDKAPVAGRAEVRRIAHVSRTSSKSWVARSASSGREDHAAPGSRPGMRPAAEILGELLSSNGGALGSLSEELSHALRMDPARALEVLRAFAREARPEVLFALSRALAPLAGQEPVRSLLLGEVDGGDPAHRECALMAFVGDCGADVAARAGRAFARDLDGPDVREAAATVLAAAWPRIAEGERARAKESARGLAAQAGSAGLRAAALSILASGQMSPADVRAAEAALGRGGDRGTALSAPGAETRRRAPAPNLRSPGRPLRRSGTRLSPRSRGRSRRARRGPSRSG
jgi:hypothetical protein